ncbi:PREDICTED: uncharacterized protein LOC109464665 [Branchiostoma belcheri]|uniref:Uncharacterized protein LOC109464665 n=1 Tax=Branchiostoma belcheri TaxID=7741 RepID=A0A6P4XL23_BRABE|nr:PREDICTED: uncharacterized protein LOC109464665 [Branchiostoma belcheri]
MAKMMVCVLAVFCGLLYSTTAVPVTTVAPGTTVTQALEASLQKTAHVLALTIEAYGSINTVHFSGTASYPDETVRTLPDPDDFITATDIETSAMQDSEVLTTLKAHLHAFERHLETVELEELTLAQDDTTGQVQGVYEQVANVHTKTTELQTSLATTANVMGHTFDNTNEEVNPNPNLDEWSKTLHAYLTFRDYVTFLSNLERVFAELVERESVA